MPLERKGLGPPPPHGSRTCRIRSLYGLFIVICCGRVVKMTTSSGKPFGGPPRLSSEYLCSLLSDDWTKMFRTLIKHFEVLEPCGG